MASSDRPLIAAKVSFAAAYAGLAALPLAGFVAVSPNRIMPGESLTLAAVAGPFITCVIVAAALLALVASLSLFPKKLRTQAITLPACLIPTALLLLAGQMAHETFLDGGSVPRVSLGGLFWVWLFIAPVLVGDYLSRARGGSRAFVALLGAAAVTTIFLAFSTGELDHLSVVREYLNRRERFFGELFTHLKLSFTAVGFACLIGLPLGYLAHAKGRTRGPLFFILNTLQTVPSLALFSILIPLIAALVVLFPALGELGVKGIGATPALVALTLYSLLPVARNTFTGFATVDPDTREAGRGMGMTGLQLMWRVELPIASPVILGGVRIALVQALGLTAVAALIGAGGFGVFIFQGLGQAADDLILLGAIPTVAAALFADTAMQGLIALIKPKGLQ